MPAASGIASLLKSKPARLLTLALIAQAVLFYTISHGENVPLSRPLYEFPSELKDWRLAQVGAVEPEIAEILRADDLMTRSYFRPGTNDVANLFVAYFKSQRTGQTPHSPKNCLPGSGWEPAQEDYLQVTVPGQPQPITINRYLVIKGDEKSVVMYWYQSKYRVVASEYKAKIYSVADAIRYNRTDTSLVRVIVPVIGNDDARATAVGVEFIQAFFDTLRGFLPS